MIRKVFLPLSVALFLVIGAYYTYSFFTGPSRNCFLELGEGESKKKYNCGEIVFKDDYTTYYLVKIKKSYFNQDLVMLDIINTNKIFRKSRITIVLGKKDTSRLAISEKNKKNLNFINESKFTKIFMADYSLIDFLNKNSGKFALMQVVNNPKIMEHSPTNSTLQKDSSTSFFSNYIESCISILPTKATFQTIVDKCDYLLVGELKIFE